MSCFCSLFFILLDFVAFGLLLSSFCLLLLSSFCLLLLSSFCLLFYIIYPIISNWDSGYLTPNVEYIYIPAFVFIFAGLYPHNYTDFKNKEINIFSLSCWVYIISVKLGYWRHTWDQNQTLILWIQYNKDIRSVTDTIKTFKVNKAVESKLKELKN